MATEHNLQTGEEPLASTPACELSHNWWAFIIRGVLILLFALLVFFLPMTAIFAFTIVFGAFSFVDGVLAVWLSVRRMQKGKHWGWLLFSDILGMLAGGMVFFYPMVSTVLVAVCLWASIGIWSILVGFMEFMAAFRPRRKIQGEMWFMLSGIFSAVMGVIILWMFITVPADVLPLSKWIKRQFSTAIKEDFRSETGTYKESDRQNLVKSKHHLQAFGLRPEPESELDELPPYAIHSNRAIDNTKPSGVITNSIKNIFNLYYNLKQDGWDVGSISDFYSKVNNPRLVYNLYENLKKSGYDVGEFPDFLKKVNPFIPAIGIPSESSKKVVSNH